MELRELQSLVGRLHSMSIAAPPVSLFLASSHALLAEAAANNWTQVRLSSAARSDLHELRQLHQWIGFSLWLPERHLRVRIDTDASLRGYGGAAFVAGAHTAVTSEGAFVEEDSNIAVLETLAVLRTLRDPRLATVLHDVSVDLYVDNEVLRWGIARYRSRSEQVRALLREILQFQLKHNVVIRVNRVHTRANVLADTISRKWLALLASQPAAEPVHRAHELRLFTHLFEKVQAQSCHWGKPCTVDACASQGTTQLPRYVCDPLLRTTEIGETVQGRTAVALDMLQYMFPPQKGRPEMIYAFPPHQLVAALWRHFRLLERRGVMVLEEDKSQIWYPMVVNEMKDLMVLAERGEPVARELKDGVTTATVACARGRLVAVWFDFST
jgi:Arc/MetJ-type ribon-helix-helix transcriptional regulator